MLSCDSCIQGIRTTITELGFRELEARDVSHSQRVCVCVFVYVFLWFYFHINQPFFGLPQDRDLWYSACPLSPVDCAVNVQIYHLTEKQSCSLWQHFVQNQ